MYEIDALNAKHKKEELPYHSPDSYPSLDY